MGAWFLRRKPLCSFPKAPHSSWNLQSSPELCLILRPLPGLALGNRKILGDSGKFALCHFPILLLQLACLLGFVSSSTPATRSTPCRTPFALSPNPIPAVLSFSCVFANAGSQKGSVILCKETQGSLRSALPFQITLLLAPKYSHLLLFTNM